MEHSWDDEFGGELERIWREAATQRVPLPTELELAKALGISRPMVREALVRLESQGLVARRAHQGTFANVAALSVPFRIDQSYELSKRLVEAGYEVKVDVVSAQWSELTEEEARDLESTPGASCFRVVKRWLADGRPLILAEDVVPARRREGVEFDDEYSVFESVTTLRGVPVEWESATLKPVLPDPAVQELLAVEADRPLLTISLVGMSLHGERLYRGFETHVPDGPEYGMVRRAIRR
ncbi:GntR family transcriptional regulator [Rhodococcus sp. NPDC003322]